jgi:hypothetical protein
MPSNTALDIPYERQSDPMSNRMCGAAALCMVYRSFGIKASQAELGPKLTRPGLNSNLAARSFLVAQEALTRGLSALVLRAKDPLRILKVCHRPQLRAILNHRLHIESASGHFTVLVDLDGEAVIVHDPQFGSHLRFILSDIVKLWRPLGPSSEITGNVLVILAQDPPPAAPCPRCGGVIPESLACPGCQNPVSLRPASVLGCMGDSCPERTWQTLFCPYCDADLMGPPGMGFRSPPEAEPGESETSQKIKLFSQEIDKFVATVLAVTNGRPVPGTEGYFKQLKDIQGQLHEAQKQEAAKQRAKATQPPPAPPPKPAPPPEPPAAKPPERKPVDWNGLSRTLLQEMGLAPTPAPVEEPADEEGPQSTRTNKVNIDDPEIQEFLKKKGLWK